MSSIKNFFLSITKWLAIACMALATFASLCFALSWLLPMIAPELAALVGFWLASAVLVTMNASTAFLAMSLVSGIITGGFAVLEGLVSLCRGPVEEPPLTVDYSAVKNDNLTEAPTHHSPLFKQQEPCVEQGSGLHDVQPNQEVEDLMEPLFK